MPVEGLFAAATRKALKDGNNLKVAPQSDEARALNNCIGTDFTTGNGAIIFHTVLY